MGKLCAALEGPMATYWEKRGTYHLDVEWVGKACLEARPAPTLCSPSQCPPATLLDSAGWCFGSPGTPALPWRWVTALAE